MLRRRPAGVPVSLSRRSFLARLGATLGAIPFLRGKAKAFPALGVPVEPEGCYLRLDGEDEPNGPDFWKNAGLDVPSDDLPLWQFGPSQVFYAKPGTYRVYRRASGAVEWVRIA